MGTFKVLMRYRLFVNEAFFTSRTVMCLIQDLEYAAICAFIETSTLSATKSLIGYQL
jgi:hypothetical protein